MLVPLGQPTAKGWVNSVLRRGSFSDKMQTKCLAKVPLRDSRDLQMEVDWRWGVRCFYTFVISSEHSLATLMGKGDDTQLFAGSSSERSPIQIFGPTIFDQILLFSENKRGCSPEKPSSAKIPDNFVSFKYNYYFAPLSHLLLEIESHAENMKL